MCFSLAWFQQLFIFFIIASAIVAILYILMTYAVSKLPAELAEGANVIARVLKIVIYAVIACFVVYFCFALITCLLSFFGSGFPLLPHR